jgi:DNA-binding XRE family transcriptional regulator
VLSDGVDDEIINCDIAALVSKHRKIAKLTQSQLAKLVETTQSVISKIEDSDYDGQSLTTLKKIAKALGKRLVVDFAPSLTCSTKADEEVFEFDSGKPGWKLFMSETISNVDIKDSTF